MSISIGPIIVLLLLFCLAGAIGFFIGYWARGKRHNPGTAASNPLPGHAAAAPSVMPESGHPVACKTCGAIIPAAAAFCPACGAPRL